MKSFGHAVPFYSSYPDFVDTGEDLVASIRNGEILHVCGEGCNTRLGCIGGESPAPGTADYQHAPRHNAYPKQFDYPNPFK